MAAGNILLWALLLVTKGVVKVRKGHVNATKDAVTKNRQ